MLREQLLHHYNHLTPTGVLALSVFISMIAWSIIGIRKFPH